MDRIARTQWVEACQAFFDAYVGFRTAGEVFYCCELNNRSIQIDFINHSEYLTVRLYCPKISKGLSGCFDQSPDHTEETIRKIHWLAWEAEELHTYELSDAGDEYRQLMEILVWHYRLCFDDPSEDDFWKGAGEEDFIIQIHDRHISVHFSPDAMWDANGYIVANLFCFETGRSCSTVVHQEEENPKEIIRLIQDMASEPEILEFSTSDSEWEHELIRNSLVGSRTKDGLLIERYPFRWVHSWDGAVIEEQRIILHDREISIRFEAQEDTLQINVHCTETGKSFTLGLPKRCRNIEEIGEELVWKIQELAWEEV